MIPRTISKLTLAEPLISGKLPPLTKRSNDDDPKDHIISLYIMDTCCMLYVPGIMVLAVHFVIATCPKYRWDTSVSAYFLWSLSSLLSSLFTYYSLFKLHSIHGGSSTRFFSVGVCLDNHMLSYKIKTHSSCEIEYFVETRLCKLCVIFRSRVSLAVCPY